MLRKTAVALAAISGVLVANFAVAQGVAPNAPGVAPNLGAGNGAAGSVSAMAQLAEFTGTIKEWKDQDQVLIMDNGERYYLRGNVPIAGVDLKPGVQVTLHYVIDAGEQNEKVIRQILPAPGGAPQP